MDQEIKLNVGASPIWTKEGWHVLDHKARSEDEFTIKGDARNIPLHENSCRTIFCSHMFEHIPHTRLEDILLQFNRVLRDDGVLRVLTPNLARVAKAYVERDEAFFEEALAEDENIRTDLGYGGMLMNFIVSPGQDTALFDRTLSEFIGGYAHLYLYDFTMLRTILEHCGFYEIEEKGFCESEIEDYREPMHVVGHAAEWRDLNQKFYEEHNLVHYYDTAEGRYVINFEITGFDRDPLTSLIVEAKKKETVDKDTYESMNREGARNYNNYGQSLLRDSDFRAKLDRILAISRAPAP